MRHGPLRPLPFAKIAGTFDLDERLLASIGAKDTRV
jgi:hypothetical protein